jgi:hypothetical protein
MLIKQGAPRKEMFLGVRVLLFVEYRVRVGEENLLPHPQALVLYLLREGPISE